MPRAIPTAVRMYDGVYVNMSAAVSYAAEKDLPQRELKPEVKKLVDEKSLGRPIREEDYNEIGKADTVSFWFIGGSSLCYVVSDKFTQADYDRVEKTFENIEYRTKDAREPSPDKADKTA